MKKKVLLISSVFYPDQVAVANLFTNLCIELTEYVDIEVWCAQPSYTLRDRQPRYQKYKQISIHHLASTNFPKDKFWGRLINVITFSISTVLRLLFSKKRSYVISHTTPPFLAIIVSFICYLKKFRNLYVIMDVFPDGLIRLKRVSQGNILIRLWRNLHLSAIKKCHKIIVIGRDMKDWLINIYPEGSDKIEYIPLWQDGDLIKPIQYDINPFVLKNNLTTSFVVQYSGNMGLWNEMKTFAEAAKISRNDTTFMFIGGGLRKKELLDSLGNSANNHVLVFPFLPNEEYAFSVTACHIALISFREGLEGMAVPSKIIGIMASGVPAIALVPDKSEIACIIKDEDCGIVVNPGDTEGLLNAIDHLKNNEDIRTRMGKNGRKAFEEKYTTKKIAERYKLLLQ